MRKQYYITAVVFVISMNAIFAGEQIRLYKEFTSGMTYSEVKNKPNVLDATELGIPAVRLYREVEKFAGQDWGQLFGFHDDKLTDVSLVSSVIEQYPSAVLTLGNSGFSLAHMESATQELDCILLKMTEPQEVFYQAIVAFEEEALNNNHLELLYIDDSTLEKIVPSLTGKESSSQILAMLPDATRTVAVVVTVLENSEPVITLSFSTPKHAMSMLTEDF